MRSTVILFLLFASVTLAWVCPACGTENSGDMCIACGVPEPPTGMVFIDACTVEIDGESIQVEPFYIDVSPVTCRKVLSVLNRLSNSLSSVIPLITGLESLLIDGAALENPGFYFIKYTPYYFSGGGGNPITISVLNGCFDNPAASLTWEGANLYLLYSGKRLPTAAELAAAFNAGYIFRIDCNDYLDSYSDFLHLSVLGLLNIPMSQMSISNTGNSEDNTMWEWTVSEWGAGYNSIADLESSYMTIFKPLEEPAFGSAPRKYGYFNIMFRGIVPIPWLDE